MNDCQKFSRNLSNQCTGDSRGIVEVGSHCQSRKRGHTNISFEYFPHFFNTVRLINPTCYISARVKYNPIRFSVQICIVFQIWRGHHFMKYLPRCYESFQQVKVTLKLPKRHSFQTKSTIIVKFICSVCYSFHLKRGCIYECCLANRLNPGSFKGALHLYWNVVRDFSESDLPLTDCSKRIQDGLTVPYCWGFRCISRV